MAERYTLAERLKAKANELFKRQRYEFARARYTRLLRLLESTRDFETDDEVAKITAYQVQPHDLHHTHHRYHHRPIHCLQTAVPPAAVVTVHERCMPQAQQSD